MSEKKDLGRIWVITDCDTGLYSIGEVDGGFNGGLKDHVTRYGAEGLLVKLGRMSAAVHNCQVEINLKNQEQDKCAEAGAGG